MLLHEWIRHRRETAGLSQVDVAAGLNVSQAYISRIENGRIRVTVELLQQLAVVIGFDVGEGAQQPTETAA